MVNRSVVFVFSFTVIGSMEHDPEISFKNGYQSAHQGDVDDESASLINDEESKSLYKKEVDLDEMKNASAVDLFAKKGLECSKNISKRIEQIDKIIENNGSVDEILIRQKQVTNKFNSVKWERDKIFETSSLGSKEILFQFEWFESLENMVDESTVNIELYLKRKENLETKDSKELFEEIPPSIENNPSDTTVIEKDNFLVSAKKPSTDEESSIFSSLKKVSLPVFSGDIKEFNNWANAFSACIDKSPLSSEAKLLHLRKYLAGDAAKVLEGVGHSHEAYELAKQRLGRRYGGERRKITIFLDEVENFHRIKPGNALELEKFANLLDILIINLKESQLTQELGSGILYLKLQQKLHKGLLSSLHRWLHEEKLEGSVSSLHTFIMLESEFETIAEETTRGFNKTETKNVFISTSNQNSCPFCQQAHEIVKCPTFLEADVEKRSELSRSKGLCFGCLTHGHLKRDCKRTIKCDICHKNHNTFFHREGEVNNFHGKMNPQISLRTLTVKLMHNGKELLVNAILDDGSSQSFINSDVAEYLKLKKFSHQDLAVGVLSGSYKSFPSSAVSIDISAVDDSTVSKIDLMTIKNVTGNLQPFNWVGHAHHFNHLKRIPFVSPVQGKIDILIGVDNAHLHQCLKEISGPAGQPIARLTPLGWTCVGHTGLISNSGPGTRFVNTFFQGDLRTLNRTLQKFWEVDEGKEIEPFSVIDKEVVEKTLNSMKYNQQKKIYQVSIPWKSDVERLPNNYAMAFKRLLNTEKKLLKEKSLREVYSKTIQNYISKGYVKKVETSSNDSVGWYLPHFPVINTNSITTKTRIVFDASALFEKTSLNEAMHCGPKLQADLIHVLLRFRQKKVAICCDIKEMYLQINLIEKDRKFHRFLWRDVNIDKEPEIFEFNRLVFGSSSSPFLAQLVAKSNATKFQKQFKRASESVLASTFMDDTLDSIDTIEESKVLYRDLKKLWAKAGMETHKWLSNSFELLEYIPEKERGVKLTISDNQNDSTKALGVRWDHQLDVLTFNSQNISISKITKRLFLQIMASVFDPLGMLCPFILEAKSIIQKLWINELSWDEEVLGEQEKTAKKWLADLGNLDKIRVPRCLCPVKEPIQFSIHVFCDASEMAYGTVLYSRCILKDNVMCNFLLAKSKIAPLNTLSIPRLELLAAVKGAEMATKVAKSLHVEKTNIHFWSDSFDVLAWIKNRTKVFGAFVRDKVGKIHSSSLPEQWKYIPSDENPADILTHTMNIGELASTKSWFDGPKFLSNLCLREFSPNNSISHNNFITTRVSGECLESLKVPKFTIDEGNINVFLNFELNPDRFSSWTRFVRVKAWVIRFLRNIKMSTVDRKEKTTGELSQEELLDAKVEIIKEAQKEAYQEEYDCLQKGKSIKSNSKILVLAPQIDEAGIIRCNGRLQYSTYLPHDVKFPIILPKNSKLTRLIVQHFHEKFDHAPTNFILSQLSTKYWLIAGREEIRRCENACFECKRRKAKAMTQMMAPLPCKRTEKPLRAFINIGVDYGGPFLVKMGRGKSRVKRYICLFTCSSTRAVHIEMAFNLDTDSFLNCFWRFSHRRGIPHNVVSDNGKNFVGGTHELRDLVANFDLQKIVQKTSMKGVTWSFNPPLSPHFGGFFECMIKAAKRAMKKVLQSAEISDEELLTAISGAEYLINSHPLTYQTANSNDVLPLTPNHFLIGQLGGEFCPEENLDRLKPVQRWRRAQEIISHFWKRWIQEWLPSLSPRSKWRKVERDIVVGDVVLSLSQKTERGKWPLGRVLETTLGADGHVRRVKILVNGKTFDRGINNISLIVPNKEIIE